MKESTLLVILLTAHCITALSLSKTDSSNENPIMKHFKGEKSRLEKELEQLQKKIGTGDGTEEIRQRVDDISYRLRQIEIKERKHKLAS